MTQGQGTHAVDVLFYATDHLGSTILAVDANQTIQTRNLYMPFGDPGAVQEGTALRHRYIGGVILEESGLYALGPRLYDPEVGRFLSPDPLVASPTNPQAFNRYSYALNNPVTLSDPSGLTPICGESLPCPSPRGGGYYQPSYNYPGSNPGPGYGNLAGGCNLDGRCPSRPQSQPQTPAISNPGSPPTQPYAVNEVEGFEGTQLAQGQQPSPGEPAQPGEPRPTAVPRGPDFFSFNLNVAIPNPWTRTLVGGTGAVTIDENGNVYVGVGPSVGKTLTFVSGSAAFGWLNQKASPTEGELSGFLTGHGLNASAGFWGGGAINYSPSTGATATSLGFFSPQAGGGYTYSWQVGDLWD